jgi:methionine-rich copper-binding protein CopC
MFSMNRAVALAASLVLAGQAPALAEPTLVTADPAANASVASPRTIELRLSEPVVPKLSGASLVMTSMPGMADHAPMKMQATTSIAPDGKTIVLKPAKKLPAGSYRIEWHAASPDAERVSGTHLFSVR